MAGNRAREVAIALGAIGLSAAAGSAPKVDVLGAVSLAHALSAQTPDPSVERVVAHMHAYLIEYSRQLPATIATEKYEQRAGSGALRQRRVLESDFGLVQIPGDNGWLGFREVRSADGRAVTDSAHRLADLFAKPSASAMKQARRIAEESARFNIGPIFRTINDPTIVLELLDPRHAHMRFAKDDEATIGGVDVWVLKFEEIGRPTIIKTRDLEDRPARGRAWVEPGTGRIHRVEATIQLRSGNATLEGTIDVRFAHDARLGFAVPAKMTERYANSSLGVVSSGEATYGNYRRFTVDTHEDLESDPR